MRLIAHIAMSLGNNTTVRRSREASRQPNQHPAHKAGKREHNAVRNEAPKAASRLLFPPAAAGSSCYPAMPASSPSRASFDARCSAPPVIQAAAQRCFGHVNQGLRRELITSGLASCPAATRAFGAPVLCLFHMQLLSREFRGIFGLLDPLDLSFLSHFLVIFLVSLPAMAESDAPAEDKKNRLYALVLVAVIAGLWLVAWAISRHIHIPPPEPRASTGSRVRRKSRGLGAEAVERIPVIAYHEEAHASGRKPPCPSRAETPTRSRSMSHVRSVSAIPLHIRMLREGYTEGHGDGCRSCCAICTENFVEGVRLRKLPCTHVFHPQCIDPWLRRRARTCPLW